MADDTQPNHNAPPSPNAPPPEPDAHPLPPDDMVPDQVHHPSDPAVQDTSGQHMETVLAGQKGDSSRPVAAQPGQPPLDNGAPPYLERSQPPHGSNYEDILAAPRNPHIDPGYYDYIEALHRGDLPGQQGGAAGLPSKLLNFAKAHFINALILGITGTIAGLLITLVGQFRTPTRIIGVPTWTPEAAAVAPAPGATPLPVIVDPSTAVVAEGTDALLITMLTNLTSTTDVIAERLLILTENPTPIPGYETNPTPIFITTSPTGDANPVLTPEPTVSSPPPQLSIWEDGNCWTPPATQVLHLCGADAGDGYVIRWNNVAGDSEGPRIPDADYLAVRSTGDKLIWAGTHPATGEQVTVNYWSAGHTLAVHAAGKLLFRIDRNHNVQ